MDLYQPGITKNMGLDLLMLLDLKSDWGTSGFFWKHDSKKYHPIIRSSGFSNTIQLMDLFNGLMLQSRDFPASGHFSTVYFMVYIPPDRSE